MADFEDYTLIAFINALKGTLATTVESDGVISTPAEAIAGLNNTTIMTPLRVQQAMSSIVFNFAPLNQAVPLSNDPVGYFLGKGSVTDDDFQWFPIASGGSVQTVAVATANGFAGTSDADPTNPILTLSTTVTGILEGNGTDISAAATTGTGAVVLEDSPALITADLGTPSAIDLTNATNVPREQPRVTSVASTATLTPDADTTDIASVTAQAAALTIAAPVGTPVDGQMLTIRIQDNGTTRALTWNAAYSQYQSGQLPADTIINKTHVARFMWNAATSVWDLIGGNPIAGLWGV